VQQLKISKLHCGQILSAGWCGLICKKLFGLPYAVYVCGSESIRFQRYRALLQHILNEASEIIVNSESTRREFMELIVDKTKIIKLTPGVDTTFFQALPQLTARKPKVLLTVARLDERKGHDKVIAALPIIRERFSEIRYYIVGDGREKNHLIELAQQHQVTHLVHFYGTVSPEKLRRLYQECDIFILPNRVTQHNQRLRGDLEGFGIAFLEAAACGKVTIGGNSGGAAEAIENGYTGLLVDPDSEHEIAQAVNYLLAQPERARQMGEQGRMRAVEHFNWAVIAQSLQQIL